ncbi:hypothetical protein CDAR_165331 [Caerostris darwini]|uniref:Uncharacterized protein n=1 Tax=Caerostris darwini TaxID=1538125 RepID=A0AAV4NZ20_9ARAC|nr:hypothetical protein CDAR_165331 [Caerostris darwini]
MLRMNHPLSSRADGFQKKRRCATIDRAKDPRIAPLPHPLGRQVLSRPMKMDGKTKATPFSNLMVSGGACYHVRPMISKLEKSGFEEKALVAYVFRSLAIKMLIFIGLPRK